MIKREMADELRRLVKEYPVVTITGPRQAGKTTLSRHVLNDYAYSNLEVPETREIAEKDPRAYLGSFKGNVIIDEIQRVPGLLSYIQAGVDEEKINGRYVLTGSHQLQLREAITQSLAGRTALLHLLPLSISELAGSGIEYGDFEEYCFKGLFPRLYEQGLRPATMFSNYYQTYVERDVRQLIQLKDASLFEKMIKLLAGRTGQLIDYSSLANDVGVDSKTIRNWLSLLEASFVVFKLPPYFENFGKRVIKAPKYYFTDVGLLCYLLGIRKPGQISRDPLVGGIFENLVVLECLKQQLNRGEAPDLYFFRDSDGNEVDLLFPDGRNLTAIEIKSAQTFSMKQLKGIRRIRALSQDVHQAYLVYTGEFHQLSDGVTALPFHRASEVVRP
jgi:predicted AAA+ superfamily ATPase